MTDEDYWEQRLAAEGMPADMTRRPARATVADATGRRPWLGPYETPSPNVGAGLYDEHGGGDPAVATRHRGPAQRPDNEYQAMMEAPPGAAIDISKAELQELREVLYAKLDTLTEDVRYILTRHVLGGETLESCGQDLGYSRQRVWNIKAAALRSLRDELSTHPRIAAYLGRHEIPDE